MNQQIWHDKPAVRGNRLLLSTILGALAGGDSVEQIEEDYKGTKEDVSAAFELARDASEYETFSYIAASWDFYWTKICKEPYPFS